MSAASEIELKLAVTSGRLADVRRRLAGGNLRRAKIDDIYFDTPSLLLRQHGLVLRMRRDGGQWLQTLKVADRGARVVSERGEWEAVLGSGKERPSLDLAQLESTPLRALVDGGLRADALAAVFRTRFVRRRATVPHRASTIEVALDDGELIARNGDHTERQRVAEVELELKAGTPADVLDFAWTFCARGRGQPVLVPSLRSKAERGHALASGSALPVARASASGFAKLMSRDIGTADALRAVVRHALAIVVANADALRGTPSIEHLHQARVALRRMRSAIRLLDARATQVPRSLVSQLGKLAHLLGDARDCDVLLDTTLPTILEAADGDASDRRELQKCATRLHTRATDDAVAAVSSRRFARLVLALAQWAASASPPSDRLADNAQTLLQPLADTVAEGGREFAGLSRRDQHRVRIHVKRLRYALDLLRYTLPAKSAADYIDALARLQDTLGELNDAAVARAQLGGAARGRSSRKLVKDWDDAVEQRLVPQAARQLKALARRARPWTV